MVNVLRAAGLVVSAVGACLIAVVLGFEIMGGCVA